MLLTLTHTAPPATDLGYLLHKNPARAQSFDLSFGRAHVVYPEASAERCTAALVLDVDPVGLVRDRRPAPRFGSPLGAYVNDRPYVASSFLSVAIAQVFGSALAGRCKERPELAQTAHAFEARLAVLPCRGGEDLLRRLFEPLGYEVVASGHPLDPLFPDWGPSPYFSVTLRRTCRLQDLLSHLYVLVPVLDDEKHYWVGADEVDKLLAHGAGWLESHPERERIATRYLRHRRSLAEEALARLLDDDPPATDPEAPPPPPTLNEQRLTAVAIALRESGARRVLDLGCGEGKLLTRLLRDPAFAQIVGVDVSTAALERAEERVRRERLPAAQSERVHFLHGSLMYRDHRLLGYDAAAVVEVVEHLDPGRLATFERVLFEHARPATVVLTTPNSEHNARFPGLAAGACRHADHRFEWTRDQFRAWTGRVSERFGYNVSIAPVGDEDPAVGPPTQMAVFNLRAASHAP